MRCFLFALLLADSLAVSLGDVDNGVEFNKQAVQYRSLAVLIANKLLTKKGGDPTAHHNPNLKKDLNKYVRKGPITVTSLADAWLEADENLNEIIAEYDLQLGIETPQDSQTSFYSYISAQTNLDLVIGLGVTDHLKVEFGMDYDPHQVEIKQFAAQLYVHWIELTVAGAGIIKLEVPVGKMIGVHQATVNRAKRFTNGRASGPPPELTPQEVRTLAEEMDFNGDGKVSFAEVVRFDLGREKYVKPRPKPEVPHLDSNEPHRRLSHVDGWPNCNPPKNAHWVGDGYCDGDDYNIARCGWDGGDCCSQTCQFPSPECPAYGWPFNCRDPQFVTSTSQAAVVACKFAACGMDSRMCGDPLDGAEDAVNSFTGATLGYGRGIDRNYVFYFRSIEGGFRINNAQDKFSCYAATSDALGVGGFGISMVAVISWTVNSGGVSSWNNFMGESHTAAMSTGIGLPFLDLVSVTAGVMTAADYPWPVIGGVFALDVGFDLLDPPVSITFGNGYTWDPTGAREYESPCRYNSDCLSTVCCCDNGYPTSSGGCNSGWVCGEDSNGDKCVW